MDNFSGSIFFIAHLNSSSDSFLFISEGVMPHTFGPRDNILSVPFYTEFTKGMLKSEK